MPRLSIHLSLVISLVASALGADLKNFDDACLHAVQFLDEHEGWAVGDEGTVWHTMDGGTLWERQPTGLRATLTSISMRDFRSGWIAGRESIPYDGATSGLLFFTKDGGGRWGLVSKQHLSGISKVQFFGDDNGWVLGQGTDPHPSGLFFTNTGGRTWTSFRGQRHPLWTAGHFWDFENGVLGGPNGSLAQFRQGVVAPLKADVISGSRIRSIAGSGKKLFAVGDEAQVLVSVDHGQHWKRANLGVPLSVTSAWDLAAVTAQGDHVWAIGRPGSVVLHSADAGATWKFHKTPVPLAMNAISFATPSKGWAVGDLGVILHTSDGGEHWTVQRQGKARASLLWVTRRETGAPLSVIARHGGDEGYIIASLLLTSPDPRSEGDRSAMRAERFADGFRSAGGAAVDARTRFPLAELDATASSDEIMARWNKRHEGKAALEIERDLTLALRLWRPSVVVTESLDVSDANPTASVITASAVKKAFAASAQATSFPEQLEFFGLTPHAATKLYARAFEEGLGVRYSSGDFSPRLEETYQDAAESAAATAWSAYEPVERDAGFRLIASTNPAAERHPSLVAGIPASPGSEGRRAVFDVDEASVKDLSRRADRKKNFLALATSGNPILKPETLLAQIKETTADLPMLPAGQTTFQLARRYADLGQWEMASATCEYMVEEFPQHPLALEAFRWLIAYHSSGEVRARAIRSLVVASGEQRIIQKQPNGPTEATKAPAARASEDPNAENRSLGTAILFANRLRAASPHLWLDPHVQLCVAAAYRKLGNTQVLAHHYQNILDADPKGDWGRIASTERWLLSRDSTTPPAPIAWSSAVDRKPYLDGKLGDECWKGGKPLSLLSGVESLDVPCATKVWLRHDEGYLYIAADCHRAHSPSSDEPVARTRHDADLRAHDRIELCLDLDRDYTSYFKLSADERGLSRDECWGDVGWNPKWFIAVTQDADGWKLEAAIPWTELLGGPAKTDQAWAFNVARILPGKGVQSLGRPAGVAPRAEGFTLLKFASQTRDPVNVPRAN